MNAANWILRAVFATIASLPLLAHADTWSGRCGGGKFICVEVSVVDDNGSSVTVSLPDTIYVVKGQKVVWRLPIGFAFSDTDGVAVPVTNNEIDSATRIDDDESDASTLSMRFRLKITKKLASSYKYTLTFHEMNAGKADTLIKCDPTIANLDGFRSARTFTAYTCPKS